MEPPAESKSLRTHVQQKDIYLPEKGTKMVHTVACKAGKYRDFLIYGFSDILNGKEKIDLFFKLQFFG